MSKLLFAALVSTSLISNQALSADGEKSGCFGCFGGGNKKKTATVQINPEAIDIKTSDVPIPSPTPMITPCDTPKDQSEGEQKDKSQRKESVTFDKEAVKQKKYRKHKSRSQNKSSGGGVEPVQTAAATETNPSIHSTEIAANVSKADSTEDKKAEEQTK